MTTGVVRGRQDHVSAWDTAVEGLREAAERLRRVVILNRDAVDVIRQQDGEFSLFYCDPPYLHETRTATNAYEHEMSTADHEPLLAALVEVDGDVILSGYRSGLYEGHCCGKAG